MKNASAKTVSKSTKSPTAGGTKQVAMAVPKNNKSANLTIKRTATPKKGK